VVANTSVAFADNQDIENLEVGASESETEKAGIRIPILMYHHIDDEPSTVSVVTPDKFKEDVLTLLENGYTPVFLTDLIAYLEGNLDLPDRPVIITFDDGYRSNYEYAFPVAKELEVKLTISLIGWSMGRDTFIESDKPIIPHMTWEEAQEMYDSGWVDIQNHTFDLHSPEGNSYGYGQKAGMGLLALESESESVYARRITKDLIRHQNDINNNVGKIPEIMCLPYGAYSAKTEDVLKGLGFKGSMTTIEGVRTYKTLSDLWAMPRLNVSNDLSGIRLIERIIGANESITN
jgi:peptidoglycan/xylan/chitin deacetylase (PgdA/CDA1 family)